MPVRVAALGSHPRTMARDAVMAKGSEMSKKGYEGLVCAVCGERVPLTGMRAAAFQAETDVATGCAPDLAYGVSAAAARGDTGGRDPAAGVSGS